MAPFGLPTHTTGCLKRPARRTRPTDADLFSLLESRMVKSQFEKTPFKFLPQCDIEDLVTEARLINSLAMSEPSVADKQLLNFILTRAKKTFAITAYIELEGQKLRNAMFFFYSNSFDDRKLPIKEISPEEIDDQEEWCYQRLASALEDPGEATAREEELWTKAFNAIDHPLISSEGPVNNENDRIWNRRMISKFQDAQKHFLAPALSDQDSNHDLDGHIVPFIERYVTYAAGSFGEVSKYKIHKSHMLGSKRPNGVSYDVFAVKEIKPDNAVDRKKVADHWASEVRAMDMMNKLDHKGHIVHFVTAFRWGNPKQHYLITEWADGGNLRNLWNERPNPTLNAATMKSVIGQLLGIAEAFNAAHNLKSGGKTTGASYRHGDLKPANILWFKPKSGDEHDIGTLKICDWGEAKNKQFATVMRHSRTTAEFGTRRYQPPEVETGVNSMIQGSEDKRRSRLYDIWAVGCITLEFIVWLLYGREGLDEFNSGVKNELNVECPFYQSSASTKRAWVHNVAAYWMKHMERDTACSVGTTALGDLLEVVETGLLVVNLPRAGGTFNEQNEQPTERLAQPRQSSQQVSAEMLNEGSIMGRKTATVPTFNYDLVSDQNIDPEPSFLTGGPKRLRADQLCDRLTEIASTIEEDYWSAQSDTKIPNVPSNLYAMRPSDDRLKRVHQSQIDYGKGWVNPKKWKFKKDNAFAEELFSKFENPAQVELPINSVSDKLCSLCRDFRDKMWSPVFSKTYNVEGLQKRADADECDLCKLLWSTCRHKSGEWYKIFPEVSFERSVEFESALTINLGQVPVLSICRGLEFCRKTEELQIGFAQLPNTGGAAHFEVIRQWIKDCDQKHDSCKPIAHTDTNTKEGDQRLPTRLLDVGKDGDHLVRLWETTAADKGEWLALSHRWGSKPHFSTTTDNRQAHRAGIPIDQLPATFRDAVVVTRALGCRYLWIDSICIVQEGKDADFNKESKRMEEVYSGAKCVIAANCASSHGDGFLKPKKPRKYVGLRREQDNDPPFYICDMIDNFNEQILDGPMNKRGWVLQEHALARRTIFFDERQTYWECGRGIRCETMSVLQNDWAKLLGDPHFPQILNPAKQAERILRFQSLYEDYSRLVLSKSYDRPTGIAGLEQRLLRTMSVQGQFGMLDDLKAPGLLRRSLLWHRGKDTARLDRITFPTSQVPVPSWSWMAWNCEKKNNHGTEYAGGINYFKIPFGQVEWENVQAPWSRPGQENDRALIAEARSYDDQAANSGQVRFIYDCPGYSEHRASLCVVLGIHAGTDELSEKRHYFYL